MNGQDNIGQQKNSSFLRRVHESAAVVCVVAVLLLLPPRVMVAVIERPEYSVRLGKVPPPHCRSLGIESRLAEWPVFTELFFSLSN